MRLALVLASCAALVGCVFTAPEPTPAPELTEAQKERVEFVGIYETGDTPGQKYSVIGPVEAADCSGSPGRPHGAEAKAMDILKRKTVALGGDAVVEVSCESVPLNCPAARKCAGNAVRWNN